MKYNFDKMAAYYYDDCDAPSGLEDQTLYVAQQLLENSKESNLKESHVHSLVKEITSNILMCFSPYNGQSYYSWVNILNDLREALYGGDKYNEDSSVWFSHFFCLHLYAKGDKDLIIGIFEEESLSIPEDDALESYQKLSVVFTSRQAQQIAQSVYSYIPQEFRNNIKDWPGLTFSVPYFSSSSTSSIDISTMPCPIDSDSDQTHKGSPDHPKEFSESFVEYLPGKKRVTFGQNQTIIIQSEVLLQEVYSRGAK